nr:hypothetical protein [Tanacetum cinerariifolium]
FHSKTVILLDEVDAFLALEDDPTSPEVDQAYFDSEGDIILLEAFVNDDLSLPPPNQGNYLSQVRKELKICEAKTNKSLIDEPPEVELKDLPPHLEYVFLEGDDKLPIIIAKYFSVEEKTAKSHKKTLNQRFNIREGSILKSMMSSRMSAPTTFQRCMMAILHELIENNMEWLDTFHLDEEWMETDQNHEKSQAVFLHLRHEVEPLEWRAPKNRIKPSIKEPFKVELKELLEHLEYVFLQADGQHPVVISSSLSKDEKSTLLNILRNHKGASAWSIVDIKGINSTFCTHKILIEDEYKPIV